MSCLIDGRNRIVVTGGAGFVGSHLCRALLDDGNEVICVDNFITGRKQNILDLTLNPRFELIRHDVQDELSVPCDQIYHLACPASPNHYQANPIKTMKTSVIGSLNMLGMAKRFNATILLASTSEIYGDPLVHPQPESYLGNVNSIGIRSCYDEGKRCAEALFSDYHRQYNLDIRIARLFNTYGPNMSPNDGRVISNFITQALCDNDITIYGDGQQTRSFCYVEDMVLGLRKLMNTAYTFPVNLGNDSEFTITSLAQKILKLTNSRSVIRQSALPSDDPKLRRPDITLAKKIITWTPSVQLNEGLEKTIEYFRNHG